MPEQPSKPAQPVQPVQPVDDRTATPTEAAPEEAPAAGGAERTGITDFVRRAVSAGVGAASRSKDDIMRAAATEVRTWLDRMDINSEVVKALTKMVIEVKTEIRFRSTEDGRLAPETSNDVKIKGAP